MYKDIPLIIAFEIKVGQNIVTGTLIYNVNLAYLSTF